MDQRFEDDLAELSGDGYLMLCRDRQMLFAEGCAESPIKLAEITGFQAVEGAIQIDFSTDESTRCLFSGATKAALESAAEKLNECLGRWR